MEGAAVEEVRAPAGEARDAGGVLPLALGGEASSSPFLALLRPPAREGVRLVEAHVADRLVRVELAHAGESPEMPAAAVLLPVERCPPALLLDLRPAVRQPEEGITVAAAGDEFQVVGVGH